MFQLTHGAEWCIMSNHVETRRKRPKRGERGRKAVKALNATEVSAVVGYPRATIYRLVRTGAFPAPIDPSLATRSWRWSPSLIAEYIDGRWEPEVAA